MHIHTCTSECKVSSPAHPLLSALKLSSELTSSAWFPSAVEAVWTFPSHRPLAAVPWGPNLAPPGQQHASQVLPCLLAAQVTRWWERSLRERRWCHFWSVKLSYPTVIRVALVAVMPKNMSSSNSREQRHPLKALEEAQLPHCAFHYLCHPKSGQGSVGVTLRYHPPTHLAPPGTSSS